MSLAITHFAIGGILTTLVVLYLLPTTRYARSVVLVGGIWGMVPDIHWVSPVLTARLRAFHHSEFANVFWLHKTFDVIDPKESKGVAALALGLFIVTALLGDRWSYTSREQAGATTGSFLELFRSVIVLGRVAGIVGITIGVIYLLLAAVHPGVRSFLGLYLGVGTILVVSGTIGVTAEPDVGRWLDRWVPELLLVVVRVVINVGTVIVGLGLLVAPLRFGIDSLSVAYAGLGSALLLQTIVFAQLWAKDDTATSRAGDHRNT